MTFSIETTFSTAETSSSIATMQNLGGIVSPLDNGTSLHKRERQTNSDFNGSITWSHGRWNHKFGGTYRMLLSNYIDVDDSSQIQTSNDFTRKNINADGSTN